MEKIPLFKTVLTGLPMYILNYLQQDEITLALNSLVLQKKYFEALLILPL